MKLRAATCGWCALAMLGASSCNVDDRGLSFSVGALGSAAGRGDDTPQAGESSSPQGGMPGGSGSRGSAGDDSALGGNATADGGEPATTGGAPATAGGAGPDQPTGDAGEGAAGNPPVVVDDPEPGNFPCGNLNRNAVDDCQETLAQNSRFDSGAIDWTSEAGLLQAWKPENARGGASSGSVSLSNTNVVAGGTGNTGIASYQCISAWTGDQFEIGARVRIAAGQGGGEAGVNLWFFGADGCTGPLLGGQDVAFTGETGKWVVVKSQLQIPAGTRSARVRLMVTKPFPQASLEAQFDDVLVVKQ